MRFRVLVLKDDIISIFSRFLEGKSKLAILKPLWIFYKWTFLALDKSLQVATFWKRSSLGSLLKTCSDRDLQTGALPATKICRILGWSTHPNRSETIKPAAISLRTGHLRPSLWPNGRFRPQVWAQKKWKSHSDMAGSQGDLSWVTSDQTGTFPLGWYSSYWVVFFKGLLGVD